ncbi:bifunctional biotin--[acetyl-CoA-carboxylase] ligase/biotin operon repressor BirA [Bowmanella dokdonensis]|uniref:Bifunctional ligase/repressor BirA n=1 Tax=Bowmanella dokdonensis TaxID=751969 RepID=A0A939DTT8_9ALTE|nr:bifunctional biotin--[acetyl-CoA-carboxylase] ligase/biotin operon repressor BirA [Bowmanella dokdonensis]MBN7827771.1 bifunctional biotin--[acetyl-CoA-carboxylase] ligase/biotin operon repressor BirA [Bowmanella dokdonensis]
MLVSTSVETKRNLILNTLADGRFHSGQELGDKLGISRAAVGKHVQALQTLGLEIFSVTGKGYRLSNKLDLLNTETIRQHIARTSGPPLVVLSVVNSTNTYLKEHEQLHVKGAACLAEAQTSGRGRQGRPWISPFGASLYLSMYWRFEGGYQMLGGLSLAVGVAIATALEESGVQGLSLKWPNDVYLHGKKLGGILVEVEGQINDTSHCIMGIGINVELPESQQSRIDQPWADLASQMNEKPDRNKLSGKLLTSLYNALEKFEQTGLKAFLEPWSRLHLHQGKRVRMICGPNNFEGECLGINAEGALLISLPGGTKAFYGGEVSVRAL